jgi:protein required for attachment to host cells
MTNYCVVVADSARARFFCLEDSQYPELESSPRLVERYDLANPEQELPGREVYSDGKARNRSANGAAHDYDDHRDNHQEEGLKRFARAIAEKGAELTRAEQAGTILLVAQSRILGLLRGALDVLRKTGAKVEEVTKDVTKLSTDDLHDYLAKEKLLPKRQRPTAR